MAVPTYRFTVYDLDSCIEMARAVHAHGGVLSSDQLAHHLEYKSANNGAFNTRIANARLFGLVEGSPELRPSARALRILFPDYPAAAKTARLEAFEAVPLYAAVLEAYQGQPLPDEKGFKNALNTRWGVKADKVSMVYTRLMECAEQAGLFETAGGRTKLLRPVTANDHANSPDQPSNTTESQPTISESRSTTNVVGVASNGLIQAALAELPLQDDASEEQLRQWLTFFESALRVVYRLPKPGVAV